MSAVSTNGFSEKSPPAKKRKQWVVSASREARETHNPIRVVVERIKVKPNPSLELIRLSIGDPTLFGNLPPSDTVVESVVRELTSGQHHSMESVCGSLPSREAVAEKYSTPSNPVIPEDVVLASGCSGALELVIRSLAGPGDNILLPRPGFCLYRCLAEPLGVDCRDYDLLPQEQWEVDLKDLESKIDSRTKLIIITDPSNPCGSVFSEQHLRDLMTLAAQYQVVVVTDEVYENMTFNNIKFQRVTDVNEDVPVITCGGIPKRYVVPGWRCGWVVVFDRKRILEKAGVVDSLHILAHSAGSSCTIVQSALRDILHSTPQQFYTRTMDSVQESARVIRQKLSSINGLSPVNPRGAMYLMVGIDVDKFRDIQNDVEFTEKLLAEQSVFVLPGKCFQYPNFIRLTVMMPSDVIAVACERIATFCKDHSL